MALGQQPPGGSALCVHRQIHKQTHSVRIIPIHRHTRTRVLDTALLVVVAPVTVYSGTVNDGSLCGGTMALAGAYQLSHDHVVYITNWQLQCFAYHSFKNGESCVGDSGDSTLQPTHNTTVTQTSPLASTPKCPHS